MEKRLMEMMKIHKDFLKSCGITADYIRSLKLFKLRHKTKRYWKIGREIKNHPFLDMINSEFGEAIIVTDKKNGTNHTWDDTSVRQVGN